MQNCSQKKTKFSPEKHLMNCYPIDYLLAGEANAWSAKIAGSKWPNCDAFSTIINTQNTKV
jgi:hypothetical protein